MKIAAVRLHPYRLRMRVPLDTAHGRIEARRGVLLELVSKDAVVGWGDACPIAGFGMEDALRCEEALTELGRAALGGDAMRDASVLLARADALAADAPGARGAYEVALGDLAARCRGIPLWKYLAMRPKPQRGRATQCAGPDALAVSALVSGEDVEAVEASAAAARGGGFGTFKLKVAGRSLAADVRRVRALRATIGCEARLRLDANGGFCEAEARAAIRDLAPLDIEMIEQPVPAADVAGLARLRALGQVPIAADEAIASPAAAERIFQARAADVAVLKPAALGGPSRALETARIASDAGCAVIVTSLLDTALGVVAAAHVAAALPAGRPADGLATGGLFEADVANGPVIEGGRLVLPTEPGLGIAPDERLLARVRSAPIRDLSA